jgi:hypothetical protein
MTRCLTLSQFPQTFLTNPLKLRIYQCKIPTIWSQKLWQCKTEFEVCWSIVITALYNHKMIHKKCERAGALRLSTDTAVTIWAWHSIKSFGIQKPNEYVIKQHFVQSKWMKKIPSCMHACMMHVLLNCMHISHTNWSSSRNKYIDLFYIWNAWHFAWYKYIITRSLLLSNFFNKMGINNFIYHLTQ